MIKSIKFKKECDRTKYSYANNLIAIERLGQEIDFKPGLNIIVGPNGSGKSTILKAIANHLGANHSGFSLVTKKWIYDLSWDSDGKLLSPVEIEHDGQPIVFGDPKRSLGLSSSGIDDEFYGEGLNEQLSMNQESSGEQSNRRITPYLEMLQGKAEFPTAFMDGININNSNDMWKDKCDQIYNTWMKGNIKIGQKTVLLDEPEAGLGLMNQILLWKKILKNKEVTDKFQIILVSHSAECLEVDGANYIELKEGYLNACRKLVAGEITDEEASKYASSLERELTKKEISVLEAIRDVIDYYPTTKTPKTALKLEDFDFIERRTYRRKNESRLPSNSIEVFIVTEKGKQFLDVQKNK